jgi:hypothetical protein
VLRKLCLDTAGKPEGAAGGSEIGDVSCSCGWQICELDPVKADAAVMRHLTDEGVIV